MKGSRRLIAEVLLVTGLGALDSGRQKAAGEKALLQRHDSITETSTDASARLAVISEQSLRPLFSSSCAIPDLHTRQG